MRWRNWRAIERREQHDRADGRDGEKPATDSHSGQVFVSQPFHTELFRTGLGFQDFKIRITFPKFHGFC
jgi:hypothetical protein